MDMKRSLSVVKKWRKQLVNGSASLEDDIRSGAQPRSGLYEFLWVLIEEAPFPSCKRMCQKLRTPKTTCLNDLHEDFGFRKCYLRWVPHSMAENKTQCRRVIFSEEVLQVVRHANETNFEHLLTGG
jgi:hypothetical protein